jgi:hypothetical protein
MLLFEAVFGAVFFAKLGARVLRAVAWLVRSSAAPRTGRRW